MKMTVVEKHAPNLSAVQDKGWAWAVCFACFVVHVIFDGIYYSVGIIFIEFLEYFGQSKSDTAVIVSLCFGAAYLMGPLFAFLSTRFGCRAVVIVGGCTSCCAYVLSIFAPNVYCLYFTFGIMAGFGYGSVYLPSILSVSYYFDKRRALATGIGLCGNGVGVLLFAPLTKYLINLYTWKGAVLIQAGIFLNAIACGLVYRPIATTPDQGLELYEAVVSPVEITRNNVRCNLEEETRERVDAVVSVIVIDHNKSNIKDFYTLPIENTRDNCCPDSKERNDERFKVITSSIERTRDGNDSDLNPSVEQDQAVVCRIERIQGNSDRDLEEQIDKEQDKGHEADVSAAEVIREKADRDLEEQTGEHDETGVSPFVHRNLGYETQEVEGADVYTIQSIQTNSDCSLDEQTDEVDETVTSHINITSSNSDSGLDEYSDEIGVASVCPTEKMRDKSDSGFEELRPEKYKNEADKLRIGITQNKADGDFGEHNGELNGTSVSVIVSTKGNVNYDMDKEIYSEIQMKETESKSTNGLKETESKSTNGLETRQSNAVDTKTTRLDKQRDPNGVCASFHAVNDFFLNTVDLYVLRNKALLMFLLGTSLYSAVYITPYLFLPDKAKSDGMNEFQASWLISAMGIANLAGRFIVGAISDFKCVNRVFIIASCMFCSGLSMAFMPLCHSAVPLFVCSGVFGFTFGGVVILGPVIVGDFVGKHKLSSAFGIINFFWGVAFLVGPPFIGWLYDVSETYNTSFFAAGLMAVTGSMFLGLILVFRCRNESSG